MSTAREYLAFADGQAAGVSPTYEALARRVAVDRAVLVTALDGVPVGWSGPHGQSWD